MKHYMAGQDVPIGVGNVRRVELDFEVHVEKLVCREAVKMMV